MPYSLQGGTLRPNAFILLLAVFLYGSTLAMGQATDTEAPSPPPSGDFTVDNPLAQKVPKDVILVKGTVPSASDESTPVPESGRIVEKVYTNAYFGMSFPFPAEWPQKYVGPPPSDSGYYVLAQIAPGKALNGASRGSILVSAQDLFFGYTPAKNALEMVNAKKNRLSADYKLERQPTRVSIADRDFYRMDYMSPVAELHWYTLTTQIRCHTIEFLLTSRDPQLLEAIVQGMEKLKLSEENAPVCIRDYATGDNVLQRVDPVLTDRKFNPIPVRIVIDKYGKVKHVHIISAFPEQARAITDALMQWEFRPYKPNGEPLEVETGIMFGKAPLPPKATAMKD
jgi:hypothetical protein